MPLRQAWENTCEFIGHRLNETLAQEPQQRVTPWPTSQVVLPGELRNACTSPQRKNLFAWQAGFFHSNLRLPRSGSAPDLAKNGEAKMQFAKQLNVLGTLLSLGFLAAIVIGML